MNTQTLFMLLPLVIVLLAIKWPRIALIVLCLTLQMWLAAIGVLIVSLLSNVRIGFKKMTPDEYQDYKQDQDDS